MAPPLQLLVHLVQQHVGQQRRQRPALRRALISLLHHAIAHDPAVQVRPDQPDHSGVADALVQPVNQNVVVDPVEELLQVHVHHNPPTGLHVRLRGKHRILRTPTRPEAVAVLAEAGVQNRLQYLQQRLLDQPVRHRRTPAAPLLARTRLSARCRFSLVNTACNNAASWLPVSFGSCRGPSASSLAGSHAASPRAAPARPARAGICCASLRSL
jgi:hypothetical protein